MTADAGFFRQETANLTCVWGYNCLPFAISFVCKPGRSTLRVYVKPRYGGDRRSVRGDRRARPGRLRVGGSRSSRLIVTSILLSVAERCPYATRRGRAVPRVDTTRPKLQIVLLTARVTDTCALSGDRTCPRIARRSMPHGGTRTTLGWSLAWSVLVCLFARCRWYLRPSYLRPV